MKLLITGMGGELGTRVARLVETAHPDATVLGIDADPPRRRLRQAHFKRIDPWDRRRIVEAVTEFAPEVVLHLGVYEPHARSTPEVARDRTIAGSLAALGAASQAGALQRVVVRSGIEVYGRRRGATKVPTEDVPPDPTSPFGHTLLRTEAVAASAAEGVGASCTAMRFAPIVGAHFPSPLGRYLRLPVVPFSGLADPTFSLIHQEDAARSLVAALAVDHDGSLNVAGPGAVTASQCARLGRRIPLPLLGPEWWIARRASELLGSPIPDHVLELMHRGRTANGTRVPEVLGIEIERSTPDVIKELYEWAPVTYLRVVDGEAA